MMMMRLVVLHTMLKGVGEINDSLFFVSRSNKTRSKLSQQPSEQEERKVYNQSKSTRKVMEVVVMMMLVAVAALRKKLLFFLLSFLQQNSIHASLMFSNKSCFISVGPCIMKEEFSVTKTRS
jgi:hypothetical protein